MRKLTLIALFFIVTTSSFAQNWLDIGLKGGYGLNMLYNKNVFDEANYNNQLTGGYGFGGKLGLNFGDMHEITFDVMSTKFSQKYKMNLTDSVIGLNGEYSSIVSHSTLDLMLMYRNNKDGRYFEVGPYLSLIKNGKYEDDVPTLSGDENAIDAQAQLSKNGYGIAMGFGAYMFGTENFGITFGARFNYQISDLVNETGKSNSYPAVYSNYESHTAFHPLTAMLVMEFNLDFAYLASSKCNRTKLMLF